MDMKSQKSTLQNIVCVTNRRLCIGDFLTRIKEIASCKPKAIILREKDLDESEYESLARDVMAICREADVLCILHNFVDTAIKLKADAIHMTFSALRIMTPEEKDHFQLIGASCHSEEEARKAESLGCSYIIAGHIFDTMSKKNLPSRGLEFFHGMIRSVDIPVYAIGGINKDNIDSVMKAGASGVCMMSGPMQCADIKQYFGGF
ncbi:MAG: thiamine phosphate synthase [Selenomonadaceae bacterium]|nr:thiamine phosphate synthase [Selenomonadaceae bacterium]